MRMTRKQWLEAHERIVPDKKPRVKAVRDKRTPATWQVGDGKKAIRIVAFTKSEVRSKLKKLCIENGVSPILPVGIGASIRKVG